MNRNKTERIATGAQPSRTVRWMIGVGVTLMLIMGLILLVLLTQATGNRALYDRNYDRLYTVNIVVAGLLLLGLLWGASRLIIRLRQGQFGSRLLVKLAGIFALVGDVAVADLRLLASSQDGVLRFDACFVVHRWTCQWRICMASTNSRD